MRENKQKKEERKKKEENKNEKKKGESFLEKDCVQKNKP